jgi:hypothetical protein
MSSKLNRIVQMDALIRAGRYLDDPIFMYRPRSRWIRSAMRCRHRYAAMIGVGGYADPPLHHAMRCIVDVPCRQRYHNDRNDHDDHNGSRWVGADLYIRPHRSAVIRLADHRRSMRAVGVVHW